MSEFKGTPGPWKAVWGGGFWVIEIADGQRISNTLDSECLHIGSEEYDDSQSNAYLIAAAPDLLSIVKEFVALDSQWHPERHAAEKRELMCSARAVIAKALGEKQ